jgi:chromosome segregation ATPase
MAKVLRQNVILGGQEFKAGKSENDLPVDVRKMASQFLVSEKEYNTDTKSDKTESAQADARFEESLQKLEEAESKLTEAIEYAKDVDSSLSEANSEISGLTTQLEDEKSRVDEAEESLAELEAAIVAGGGNVVRDEDAEGSKVTVETAKEEKTPEGKKKK